MNKNREKLHWHRSLVVTVILILLMVAASFVITGWISREEEERSFTRLRQEAGQVAGRIEEMTETDRAQLEEIATVVARYGDFMDAQMWDLLDSYVAPGMISRLELLLPDDTLLTTGGRREETGGQISFAEEAAQGEHISAREKDFTEDGGYVVRHYVPVIRDGETVAMISGVVELADLPNTIGMEPYEGQAALYLIEGETGDFLMDTWHGETGGNIWALGERKMAPGYDHETLKEGLTEGRTAYVVFDSQTTGEQLYFYYQPVGVNDWRIALSVPESVVFSSAREIQSLFRVFLAFEAICFFLYFLWMVFYVRSVTDEKQRQLDTIHHIYDVEKLLFNAHENRENLSQALEKISGIIGAKRMMFWLCDGDTVRNVCLWKQTQDVKEQQSAARESIKDGKRESEGDGDRALGERILAYFERETRTFHEDSVTAVPVRDTEGKVCGILAAEGARNISGGNTSETAMLKSLEFSFGMFCQNLQTYRVMREQGEMDFLTGLSNRNRFEVDLAEFAKEDHERMACIYIDVNGLHERNNSEGHEAGDRMLKAVAEQIRSRFGERYCYRIGGDEFVVFTLGMPEEMVKQLAEELKKALEKDGIYVSVGLCWKEKVSIIDPFVRSAEKQMYAAKKKFYEQEAHDRRRFRK